MKRWFMLLALALALPVSAGPPDWDVSNTYWTAQARDIYYASCLTVISVSTA